MRIDRTTFTAMAGGFLMGAHQVSAKAVRDSFFLSHFAATELPKMIISSAILTIFSALLVSRLMRRYGPRFLIPAGFILSSMLHIVEYFLFQNAPSTCSIILYLHTLVLGSVVMSGFWSLMSEVFDPRAAKQVFSRIGAMGTLGGIIGGVVTERMAALNTTTDIFLLLAAFHCLCGLFVFECARRGTHLHESVDTAEDSPFKLVKNAPHLRLLVVLVVVGTCSAAILDYLFKSAAGPSLGKGSQMLRFFAVFYTTTQIIGFLFQTFLTKRSLQNLGIGKTISFLPLAAGAGALGGMIIPAFGTFAVVRGLESVLRGSTFRAAYEILYTPVRPAEKRAAKTLIDVACDRAGDALGGGIVQVVLLLHSNFIVSQLLGVAMAFAAVGVWISLRLDSSYSLLVQQRLMDKAVEFDLASIHDSTTYNAIKQRLPSTENSAPFGAAATTASESDALLHALRELRSGEAARVLTVLSSIHAPQPILAAQLVRLLAWDEVASTVRDTLLRDPFPITGLLVDHLVNPQSVEFGIRRRIPSILARCESPLAVQGLLSGLQDERFEVRFHCARALDSIAGGRPEMKPDPGAVFEAIRRELHVSRSIWSSRRLLENPSEMSQPHFFDGVIREKSNKSLEYIFSLLATVLPRDPVKIAFRALHTDDKSFQNLAFEFLEGILPADIRQLVWDMAEPGAAKLDTGSLPGETTVQQLLSSRELIADLIASKYGRN